MKLIEKLAEDDRSNGVHLDPATAHEDGFLAGFRQAREMAVTESTRYSSEGKDLGPLAYRLTQLGEEEVSPSPQTDHTPPDANS